MELDDVQGLVRFGYRHLTEACFLLLPRQGSGRRATWLARAPVTSAVEADPLPQTALHVAFTSEGLRALDVAPDLCAEFSAEFVAGMASDAARAPPGRCRRQRSSRLAVGHRRADAARRRAPLCRPGRLAAWEREIEAQCAAGFERIERLSTSATQLAEPFGFADGISQPKVDWERERPVGDHDRLDYDNLVCLGEFLLGYPNEYGLYTPRPLLAPQRDPDGLLPRAEDAPEQADLGRNGCYLVMRQLQQDVQGFWRELDRQARRRCRTCASGWPRPWWAGRRTASSRWQRSGDRLNDFTYEGGSARAALSAGRAHPTVQPAQRGSAARRARTPLASLAHAGIQRGGAGAGSGRVDTLSSPASPRTKVRRDAAAAARSAAGFPVADVGLHFICLAANIKRQFEFVQSAWLVGSKFAGLTGESDPMLGHRLPDAGDSPTDGFSIPQAGGPDCRLSGLPQFVTVLGGAYFFLPGIRALRYLATDALKGSRDAKERVGFDDEPRWCRRLIPARRS